MKDCMLRLIVVAMLLLLMPLPANSGQGGSSWIPKVDIPEVDIPEVDIPKAIIPKAIIPKAIIPKAPDIPEVSIPEISHPNTSVRENEQWVVITLASDVLFDFDKSNIRPDAQRALEEVYQALTGRYTGMPFQLHGHTDAKGTDAYNMRLSQRRVNAVKAWLVRHGIPEKRITTYAHGESQPVAPNTHKDGSDNPEGRQLNRRVEIYIHKVVHKKPSEPITADSPSKP